MERDSFYNQIDSHVTAKPAIFLGGQESSISSAASDMVLFSLLNLIHGMLHNDQKKFKIENLRAAKKHKEFKNTQSVLK